MVINMKSQGLHISKNKVSKKNINSEGTFHNDFQTPEIPAWESTGVYLIGKNKHTNKKKHGIPFK